jgi:hypothetical protein
MVAGWEEARISAEAISRAGPLQHMLHSALGSRGLGSEITASSITASIALRSLTGRSPTTAAGAKYGRDMDRGGSTSAATMATSAEVNYWSGTWRVRACTESLARQRSSSARNQRS